MNTHRCCGEASLRLEEDLLGFHTAGWIQSSVWKATEIHLAREKIPSAEDRTEKQIQEKDDHGGQNSAKDANAQPYQQNEEIRDKNQDIRQPAVTQRPAKKPTNGCHKNNRDEQPNDAGHMLALSRQQMACNVVE
jgi:hypothetical protein